MKNIVGIDEAGRGPLAGPVAVGVVMFRKSSRKQLMKTFAELARDNNLLRDSKKLSEKKREEIFTKIVAEAKKGTLAYTVSFGSAASIDKKGIVHVIFSAIEHALKVLKAKPLISEILLDGSLYAPREFKKQCTIIKGDEKELAIALASICAKVLRDRKMVQLSKTYPQYGFAEHKGYGTLMHRSAIKKYGPSKEHRVSFCTKLLK